MCPVIAHIILIEKLNAYNCSITVFSVKYVVCRERDKTRTGPDQRTGLRTSPYGLLVAVGLGLGLGLGLGVLIGTRTCPCFIKNVLKRGPDCGCIP